MLEQPFRLSWTLARDSSADEDDLRRAKSALRRLGYYDGEEDPHADSALFAAVESFQSDHGLDVDGRMKPGGPTEARLRDELDSLRPERARADAASSLTGYETREEVFRRARDGNRRLAERWIRSGVPQEVATWVERSLLEGDAAEAMQSADLAAQSPGLRTRLQHGSGILADRLSTAAAYDASVEPQKIVDRVVGGLRNENNLAFAKVDDVNRPRLKDRELFKELHAASGIGVELGDAGFVHLRDAKGRLIAELPRAFARSIARTPKRAADGFGVLERLHAGEFASDEARRAFATRQEYGTGAELGIAQEIVDPEMYAALTQAEAARAAGADAKQVGALLAPTLFPEALDDAEARGSLLLALVPGLGNVESAMQAMERSVEVADALSSGNWAEAAEEAAFALLAAGGALSLPGLAGPSLAAMKRVLQPVIRKSPAFGAILAGKRAAKYREQFDEAIPSVPLHQILGPALSKSPVRTQSYVKGAFPNILGRSAEREVVDTAQELGIPVYKANPENQTYQVSIPIGIGHNRKPSTRVYDAVLEEHMEQAFSPFIGAYVRRGKKGRVGAEVKEGDSKYYGTKQETKDANRGALLKSGIEDVALFRLPLDQVPERIVMEEGRRILTSKKAKGVVSDELLEVLLEELRTWHRHKNTPYTFGEALGLLARATVLTDSGGAQSE